MDQSKSILHEIYVYCEWNPEPEYIQKPDGLLPEKISSVKRWLKHFGPKKTLFDNIIAHKDRQQKWHIALGDEGKVIAVLTDTVLEIRTKRSDYATIAARTTVTRDHYPQWRKVEWSPDCAFLAVAYGVGNVEFYDLSASKLFTIEKECSRPGTLECTDMTHAISNIIYLPVREKSTDIKWNWEVLLVGYDGSVRAYMISLTEGSSFHHRVDFKGGIGAAAYCNTHNTVYLARLPYPTTTEPEAAHSFGLTAWRVVNEEPHLKLSVVSDNVDTQANDKFNYYIPFMSHRKVAVIIDMQISPDGGKLVCSHSNGDISVWRLPLLKLIHSHSLAAQPGHDLRNPLVARASLKTHEAMYHAADVNWWSNEEIIVSRFSGAVAVCGVGDLVNLLSHRVEFLQGAPRVTRAFADTFLALECESNVLRARRPPSDDNVDVVKDEEDSGLFDTVKELVKSVLYAITDIETFQPRPRRITCLSRIYRLLAVKSTTPLELFSGKIESGKYNEALSLAETFNLDKDLVYQQQWRKNPVSTEAIKMYLSKVSNKIWAVNQCVDRLPETMAAAKELLQFGLKLTNQQILEEINKERPPAEQILTHETIVLEHLNAYSSELLRCRHVMLFYWERLQLYEMIISGEKSIYVKEDYHRLRCNSIIHSCIEVAKEGRIYALHCMWSYLPHGITGLAVLEKLPEIITPIAYHHLLPKEKPLDKILVERMSRLYLSKKYMYKYKVPVLDTRRDWCRQPIFRSIWGTNWSEQITPDKEIPSELSETGDLTLWYKKRAYEIEERSGFVGNALMLLQLGSNAGITGLDKMIFDLITLETLVYGINLEDINLQQLEKMTPIQTCKALMSRTIPELFIRDLNLVLLPYTHRYDKLMGETRTMEIFNKYLEAVSKEDLCPVLLLMENPNDFQMPAEERVSMAYRCVMAYNGTDQLDIATDLISAVKPPSPLSSPASDQFTGMAQAVWASAALLSRGVRVPPRDLCPVYGRFDQAKAVGLLTRLARDLPKSEPKPTVADWEKLLNDMIAMQKSCFYIVSENQCYEIYAAALLTSGEVGCIKLAGSVVTCAAGGGPGRVPYEPSVQLVLSAAREYYNSASTLIDPALDLARCCLTLIKDTHPEIQQELDLIQALAIIHSFNVEILPIKVRLNDNRMQLIRDCLEADPSAHLASHKLIKLAELLRVEADDDVTREGEVLMAICSHASRKKLWSNSLEVARRLAALRLERSAPYIARVAMNASGDRDVRRSLLSAALATCPFHMIEDLLTARARLELDGLAQMGVTIKEASQLAERCPSTDDEFTDAITTPVVEKKDLVPSRFEKKIPLFNYLLDSFQNKFSVNQAKALSEQTKRAVHVQEFYHSLYPEHAVSDSYYRYDGFSADARGAGGEGRAAVGQAVLRWYYLSAVLAPLHDPDLEPEVIQKCAEELIYSDTSVGVACLLRGAGGTGEAVARFVGAGHTEVAFSCALYATAIHCNHDELKDEVYLTEPRKLAERAVIKDTREEHKQVIRQCMDRLSGMAEVETLKSLGLHVNGLMFNADPDYRREMIMRLARMPGKENLTLATSLCVKYCEDALEAWLQHACAAPAQTHLTRDSLPPTDDIYATYVRIMSTLYPAIQGTQHAALIQMFTVLKGIDDKLTFYSLTPTEHIKLLKKCKAASSELDYKLIVESAPEDAVSAHLVGVLRPENVGMVGKFLRTLPPAVKLAVSVHNIYTQWLTKYFFSVPREHESSKKWMQQYRQCASYFNKLPKEELVRFVEETCFSAEAVERVPYGTRNLMILQAVDYCTQEQENEIKIKKEEQGWSQRGQELSRWARFLDNYHSPAVANIKAGITEVDEHFWQQIEMSHGCPQRFCDLAAELVQCAPAAVTSLLQCLNVDIQLIRLFLYAAKSLVTADECASVVGCMTRYAAAGVTFPDDVIAFVLQQGVDLSLPAHLQIQLMALKSVGRSADPEDVPALARYSIQLFRAEWPDLPYAAQLTEEQLSSEEGRRAAFAVFLEAAASLEQRKALIDVLACWPATHTPDYGGRSLQCDYLKSRLQDSAPAAAAEIGACISLLLKKLLLNDEEIQWLMQDIPSQSVVNMMSIVLLNKCPAAKDYILKLVHEHEEFFQDYEIDQWMFTQLAELEMLIPLVPTTLYHRLAEYIVQTNTQPYNLQWAADKLLEAGYMAEAGHLYLLASGVTDSLRGFSETLLYCKNAFLFKRGAPQ